MSLLQSAGMPIVSEVSVALDPMAHDRFDGLLALSNLLVMHQRNTIAEFAMKQRDFMATDWRAVRASNEKMSLLREGPWADSRPSLVRHTALRALFRDFSQKSRPLSPRWG